MGRGSAQAGVNLEDEILRRPSILFGLTGLTALAACGEAPEPANGSQAPVAANAPGPAAAAKPPVLEGEGLRLGASRLAFGTPRAAAIDKLTKALGAPPGEQGANEECGGGGLEFAEWKSEITLWFEEGRFAGWDEKGRLKTAGGVGLGSSRSDLASLDRLEIEESTLGTEFRAAGLGGILDSKAPDAKVTDLWGGATCVFR
jgi:hypothetical protein